MEFYILDKDFAVIDILESFSSMVWNEKYYSYGDFQTSISGFAEVVNNLRKDYYISRSDSNSLMIIEGWDPNTNTTEGHQIMYTGRDLKSILKRRIIWKQTTISGNFQNAIKKLVTENAISPSDPDRKIPKLIFEESTDPAITSITIEEMQFTGNELYEVVEALCKQHKVGWDIILKDNQMVFKLYSGKNRGTSQVALPQITFSVQNDNLISSNHKVDTSTYRNVTLIAGEGEGLDRKTATYGSASGLDRRELFTDARDISSNEGSDDAISPTAYQNLLIERGKTKLSECKVSEEVEATVDTSEYSIYQFNEDYFMGDIVNVIDVYGNETQSRITEMTTAITETGIDSHPIFEYEEV